MCQAGALPGKRGFNLFIEANNELGTGVVPQEETKQSKQTKPVDMMEWGGSDKNDGTQTQ